MPIVSWGYTLRCWALAAAIHRDVSCWLVYSLREAILLLGEPIDTQMADELAAMVLVQTADTADTN